MYLLLAKSAWLNLTSDELLDFILKKENQKLNLDEIAQIRGGVSMKGMLATGGLLAFVMMPFMGSNTAYAMNTPPSTSVTGSAQQTSIEQSPQVRGLPEVLFNRVETSIQAVYPTVNCEVLRTNIKAADGRTG